MADSKKWDRELSKIDRLIDRMPDEPDDPAPSAAAPAAVPPASGSGAYPPSVAGRPAASPEAAAVPAAPSRLARAGVWLLATVSVAAALFLPFWPFAARCGAELLVYMAAVGGTGLLGVWTSVRSWKLRAPRAHVVGLLVLAWSVSLAAIEVMPRAGLALPTPERPAVWGCGGG